MAPKLELSGILPAMLTPFTADGSSINTAALAAQTDRLIDAGVGGLIPGGSTGEFTSLSHDERKILHSTVVEAAKGRVPVIAQTGAMTTAEAIELSQHAEKVGAASIMVVPPYYDPLSFREIKTYYSAVAESVNIPIMLYHIPSVTGQHLSADQIGELAQIPGIESIKDSGGDAGALTHVRERFGNTLQIANGWDILTYFGLSYGLKASVWGAANIFPELAVELFDSIAVRGDVEAGRKIWSKIVPILTVLDAESYTARVKAASALVGLETGPSRPPLLAPEASAIAELKSVLSTAGLSVK